MFKNAFLSFALVLVMINGAFAQDIDDMWDEVSRTVKAGDFEGYAAVYHPDAVLVNGISGVSYPISEALAGWKQGFDDTAAGKMEAEVIFRFSKRLHGEATAHDTGIFRYRYRSPGEEWNTSYVNFQALSVKKDGRWLMMMEYQEEAASQTAWDKLSGN